MARTNITGARLHGNVIGGGNKHSVLSQTLGATFVVAVDMPGVIFLDPGGAGRDVTLPAVASSKGLAFTIVNTADNAEDLTVKNVGGDTIGVVGQGDVGHFYSNGVTWFGQTIDTASIVNAAITTLTVATSGTFANTALKLTDTGGDHQTTVKQNSNEAANRVLNIPALGADATLAILETAQTFLGAKTFNDIRVPVTAASTAANISNNGITTLGSTAAKAYTLSAPVAGAKKTITCTGAGTAEKTVNAAAGTTFNGTDDIAKFNAAEETLDLVGLSTSRWAVRGNVGAVALSTA